MAGTFGMKTGTYDLSMLTGAPLFERVAAVAPDLVASECSTCRMQIAEATVARRQCTRSRCWPRRTGLWEPSARV